MSKFITGLHRLEIECWILGVQMSSSWFSLIAMNRANEVSKTKAGDSESQMQWVQFQKVEHILARRHKDTERMIIFSWRLCAFVRDNCPPHKSELHTGGFTQ